MPLPPVSIPHDSSFFLDHSQLVAANPLPEELRQEELDDTETYISRIAHVEEPSLRLKIFLKSIFNIAEPATHEALEVRAWTLIGLAGGGILGGLLRNSHAHANYVRRHNADIFEGKYRANRAYWDTLLRAVLRKGLRYGIVTGILLGSSVTVGYGSIIYRDRIYLPDWVAGFATIGALSRLWIGSRGVLAGGVMGSAIGLMGWGLFSSLESLSGVTVGQQTAEHHVEWLKRKETVRRQLQIRHEKWFTERMMKGGSK